MIFLFQKKKKPLPELRRTPNSPFLKKKRKKKKREGEGRKKNKQKKKKEKNIKCIILFSFPGWAKRKKNHNCLLGAGTCLTNSSLL